MWDLPSLKNWRQDAKETEEAKEEEPKAEEDLQRNHTMSWGDRTKVPRKSILGDHGYPKVTLPQHTINPDDFPMRKTLEKP
jgi:hypothetical protein